MLVANVGDDMTDLMLETNRDRFGMLVADKIDLQNHQNDKKIANIMILSPT